MSGTAFLFGHQRIGKQQKSATVQVGIDHTQGRIYIKGITPIMPDAFIEGTIDETLGRASFATPQFLGNYDGEETSQYPIFFQAYNGNTGQLLSRIGFTYNAANHTFAATSAVIAIGINKTGLLGLQNMYNATFTPDKAAGIETVCDPTASGQHPVYDLQGRRIDARHATSNKGILISNGKKVVLR